VLLLKDFFLGDILLVTTPHKVFQWENIRRGIIPLWNPDMWGGFPEIADITLGLFNPFNIIHFLVPDLRGITLAALASYFLAFYGTHLLLRNEGLSQKSAFLGGLIFTFSGTMINITLDIIRLESIAFLPWTLLALRKKKYFLTTILLTLNFLVGQTQHYYMSILFIGGYLLFFAEGRQKISQLSFLGLSVAFSLALSAFAFLPQWNLIEYSSRSDPNFKYNTIWSLHPASLIRFVFADFWGKRSKGIFWGPDVTYSFGYVGFIPLVLILTNLKKLTKKSVYFLIGAAVALLIAFGKHNPFYDLFFLIPGFKFFRNPSSWLVIYSFSIACLTAFIVEKMKFDYSAKFRKILTAIAVVFLISSGAALLIFRSNPTLPNKILTQTAGAVNKSLSSFHNVEVDQQLALLISRNIFILGILCFIFALSFNRKILLLVVFIDLFLFSKGDLFLAAKVGNIFEKTAQQEHLQYLQEGTKNYRFVSTAEFKPVRGMSIYMGDYFKRPPFKKQQFWSLNEEEFKTHQQFKRIFGLLPPNVFTAYNIPSINGYSSFSLQNFRNYFQTPSENLSLSAQRVLEVQKDNTTITDPTRINFDVINFDDPRLEELSVKYVLADEKLQLENYNQVFNNDTYRIYANSSAPPRAQILNQQDKPIKDLQIDQINPNQIKISLNDYQYSKNDYLLVRDTYYPGWQAYDQNSSQLELKQKKIFKKILINDSTKEVELIFRPKGFYQGLKISLFASIFTSAFFLSRRLILGKDVKKPLKKAHSPANRDVNEK
jgi:hypothetical protein